MTTTKTDKNAEIAGSRRSLVTGMGVAVAGLAAGAVATRAEAQGRRGFQPTRHEQDAWMDQATGGHRIFVDSATAPGGAEALLYSNNLFSSQQSGYGGEDSDLSIVICFRHFSTPFGYGDAIWKKYGAMMSELMSFTDPDTGRAPDRNLMNAAERTTLPNFGVTIDAVTARGAQFAICSAATQFIAMQIAQGTGSDANEIRDELMAGAIPLSRFVPAGVIALTRAQEYGYSLLFAG